MAGLDAKVGIALGADRRLRSTAAETLFMTLLALVLAPTVAPPITFFLLTVNERGSSLFESLLALPFVLLTFHGMTGYVLALVTCAALGLPLSLAARSAPRLRSKWIWLAAGTVCGGGLAMLFPFDFRVVLSGAAAGGLTALIFRLVVGRSWNAAATA
jgi:hypothetical protein